MSADAAQPFTRRAILVLLTVGIVGAIGFLLMSAYAPDLRSGRDGGGHAMSVAATGFKGLYDLNAANNGTSEVSRVDDVSYARGLLVLTPPAGTSLSEITERLVQRRVAAAIEDEEDDGDHAQTTLIVLPKWITVPDPSHPGWVRAAAPLPPTAAAALVPTALKVTVMQPRRERRQRAQWDGHADAAFDLPAVGQSISSPGLVTLIADPAGGAVLAQIRGQAVYILADPDIIDNQGLKRLANARGAVAMLDAIAPRVAGLLTFDVTLNGLGRSPSLLKLAFEPPFLAVTLCLLAAAMLAGVHAVARFGPPLREARALAFGKTALLDNSADLIQRAGREGQGGDRYLALTREAAAAAIGVSVDRADTYLDTLERPVGRRWSDLSDQARAATTKGAVVVAARALHDFRKDVTRDRG